MFQLGILSSFVPYLLLSLFYVIGWFVYPNTEAKDIDNNIILDDSFTPSLDVETYSDFNLNIQDDLKTDLQKDYYTFNYTINGNLYKYLPILDKCHRSLETSIVKEKKFYISFFSRPPTRK